MLLNPVKAGNRRGYNSDHQFQCVCGLGEFCTRNETKVKYIFLISNHNITGGHLTDRIDMSREMKSEV